MFCIKRVFLLTLVKRKNVAKFFKGIVGGVFFAVIIERFIHLTYLEVNIRKLMTKLFLIGPKSLFSYKDTLTLTL
jgi:hypothetical protein